MPERMEENIFHLLKKKKMKSKYYQVVHTCLMALHFGFTATVVQLNSLLPEDFTDIFQGLAFKLYFD